MLSSTQLKSRVNRQLKGYFKAKISDALVIDEQYAQLLRYMETFILRSGKRMRPYLAYLSYHGLGGDAEADFMNTCISLEVLHNFLLIHDDIIDRDYERYGGYNIAGTYQKHLSDIGDPVQREQLSTSMALLAGDLNASFASDIILNSKFSAPVQSQLLSLLNKTIFEVVGGEQLDSLAPISGQLSEEQVLKIYKYKSAIYSILMPLQFGAICVGKPRVDFKKYAYPIGIAFQLTDDILGIYGDQQQIGKPVLSDLREGKKTVLMLYALKHAKPAEHEYLAKQLGNPKARLSDLVKVQTILSSCGAKAYVEQLASSLCQDAKREIKGFGFNAASAQALMQLSDFAIKRQH